MLGFLNIHICIVKTRSPSFSILNALKNLTIFFGITFSELKEN